MEATKHRKIESGEQYEHFFPAANLKDETVKKGATVSDTVKFIPKVVRETLPQTKKISEILQGNTLVETCRNIWDFVYHHIRYQKDEEGKEQIRSPARTWHDRHRGVDCDCYTVFISSILMNLKIPHRLRIAKYKKDFFQHIYPVVPRAGGKHITIDCVVDYFNYEEPFTEIKDTTMDLEYLSGTDDSEEFGRVRFFQKAKEKTKDFVHQYKDKAKSAIVKTAHIANRANPATVLLRTGVLASMKLNIFKVAQRLKYAYLTNAEAQKRSMDMGKFQKLKTIREKLEKIFYGAGGKPENLKKAILTGKGNKNRDVNGLGYTDVTDASTFSEITPMPQLLGNEIYYSEVLPNGEDLGGASLGEPVTAASITAASGAIAAIAGLLKSIGSIFPKKQKGSDDFENTENEGDEKNLPAEIEKNMEEMAKMEVDSDSSESEKKSSDSSNSDSSEDGFWQKNKNWLKPTLIGATGLGLLYLGYRAVSKKENPKQLSGTSRKKNRDKKKTEVALV